MVPGSGTITAVRRNKAEPPRDEVVHGQFTFGVPRILLHPRPHHEVCI